MIAAVSQVPAGWGEDEMSVLPRHTKVVVTGNNRTKSVLVGLHGVVKKAVGLGGWHWLVLTNGIEVKLQRNALSVIEPPTGNEDDDKFDCENMQWNSSDIASDDAQSPKAQRSRSRQNRGFHRKSLSRSMSCDSHSKTSVSSSSRAHTKVDLSKLELTALWRYWHHFNLDASPNPSREQLIDAVQRHFMSQVIIGFVQAAKRPISFGMVKPFRSRSQDPESKFFVEGLLSLVKVTSPSFIMRTFRSGLQIKNITSIVTVGNFCSSLEVLPESF